MPAVTPRWWPRIVVMALLVVASVWAGATIRLETELLALLPQELASVRGLDGFQRQFASDREVILVADDALPVAAREEAFRKLRPALAALPGVESVTAPGEEWLKSAPQLAAWAIWNLPPGAFAKVTAALRPEAVQKRLEELPSVLAGALDAEELAKRQFDPLGLLDALSEGNVGQQSSAQFQWTEQPVTALTITASRPLIAFQDCADFSNAIHAAVARELPGETRLLLTGRPAFTAEISTKMRHDMILMVLVAVTLASAAFWAFYRALKPLSWILIGQFLALGVGLIAARLGAGSLNVISMGFGCILLGISMDYSILVYHHFASPFREERGVWQRLRHGIWFSAATTAAAFLVLAFSSVPGLRQLATLVAAGLIASAWFATWLLPAAWAAHPPKPLAFIQTASGAMARGMEKRGRLLLLLTVLVALPVGWRLLRDPASYYAPDLNRMQPTSSEAFRGQLVLAKNDPSSQDAIYLVVAPTWDAVKLAAEEFTARFPAAPRSPLTAFLPSPVNQTANAKAWPAGTAARLAAAFADAGLGEEWNASTLTFATALDHAAGGAGDAFRTVEPLLSKLARKDGAGCRAIIRIPGVAEQPTPAEGLAVAGAEILPVSWVALKTELNATSSHDLKQLGGWALAAIVILCALAQRSVRMVLLNFAALVLSLLLLAALLTITGTQFNALTLLCVPLLLGLVVDYSLHVLMALEHDGGDFHKLYAHIGAPILLTGLASCIGFGAPMLTSQPALQNFGLVMDLGIISAVFACLFLLPVLARLTKRTKSG